MPVRGRFIRPSALVGSGVALTILLAACGGEAASSNPTPSPTPTAKPTVEFRDAGAKGKVLVASSNQMTVYTFTKDTANSGTSACKAACLARWPALTVTGGEKPAPGPSVTGTLGTITRDDTNAIQVTYNGLPLYFFSNDKAPGDTSGDYTNWLLIKQGS